jgi:phosphatidate cytidylyltransferase
MPGRSLFAQIVATPPLLDWPTMFLLGGVLALLGAAFGAGQYLQRQPETAINQPLVKSFNNRVRAWWLMYAIIGASLLFGTQRWPAVVLFFLISFWGLREFITLTPTRLGDHRALFWVFAIFAPLQYVLVGLGQKTYQLLGISFDASQLFTNLIPIYGLLFIPARVAFAGDPKRFLERVAKISVGLYLCVYALSHAPALLDLRLVAKGGSPWKGGNAGVLVFLILVVQMADVFQFIWSHWMGKRVIAPSINTSKTWEGLIAGVLTATLIGMGLWWVTPFTPLQAAAMSMLLAIMGFAGSMVMSAIKRDRGVQDYGTLVEGHVGVLDRFDSICFAAPVFFHVTRFFFT